MRVTVHRTDRKIEAQDVVRLKSHTERKSRRQDLNPG